MRKFNVKLKGVTPYMQHRMDDVKLEEWEKCRKKIIERDDANKEDTVKAEYHCYRDEKTGSCFIPAEQIKGSLINGGGFMKSKVGNARKSMKNIVAAMFYITPEKIFIPDYDDIDKRSAVNHNNKARVMVIRPKWSEWACEFTLLIDDDTLTLPETKQLFEYAGKYCGVGSFRPTNNGSFGRFELSEFKEIKK